MVGTLRRITRWGLLLGGGAAGIWLLSAALDSPTAGAAPVDPLALVAATANTPPPIDNPLAVVGGVTSTLVPLVGPVVATVLGPVSTLAAPARTPVDSLLSRDSLGGVLTPPPAPIPSSPIGSILARILPVVPAVAEPTGALAFGRASESAARATEAELAGSVPGSPVPPPRPRVPLPAVLAPAPPAPTPGLPELPPLPSGTGGTGSSGPGGGPSPQTDRDLPDKPRVGSPLQIRAPTSSELIISRLVADDPSFSPD